MNKDLTAEWVSEIWTTQSTETWWRHRGSVALEGLATKAKEAVAAQDDNQ